MMTKIVAAATRLKSAPEAPAVEGGVFTPFFNKLYALCAEFQTAGTLSILALGILLIGVPLIVGTDEARQKAKARVWPMIIGAFLLLGAFTLAASAGNDLAF